MKNKITQIDFVKMVASGNDFVVAGIKNQKSKVKNLDDFARKICDRKYGVGANGLLLIEKSKVADFRMRIFNPDGSEAEMCGNGLRCAALYKASNRKPCLARLATKRARLASRAKRAGRQATNRNQKKMQIETKAGILEATVSKELVKVRMTDPTQIKTEITLNISGEKYAVHFINTGVPHAVLFVNNLRNTNVKNLGKFIRFHPKFLPQGTNVDFVEIENKKNISLRTYERGVEDETLACGTGAAASAIISNIKYQKSKVKQRCKINVKTQGGEVLNVYFDNIKNKVKNVWLEGKAKIVYKGVYNV